MRQSVAVVAGMAITVAGVATAQGDSGPKFEAASERLAGPPVPGPPGGFGGPGTSDPGRVWYPRSTLRDLMLIAYDVAADQIVCPDWAVTERYAVAATISPGATKGQFKLMLQNLLAERFQLRLHHETRDLPVLELVVADGGPRMGKAEAVAPGDAGVEPPSVAPETLPVDRAGFPVVPPGLRQAGTFNNGIMRLTFRRTSVAELAQQLRTLVNLADGAGLTAPPARVVDHTGLSDLYDFTLEFAGSPFPPAASVPGVADAAAASEPGGSGPNLAGALERQLGLRLVRGTKAPFDVLVVDHALKTPVAN